VISLEEIEGANPIRNNNTTSIRPYILHSIPQLYTIIRIYDTYDALPIVLMALPRSGIYAIQVSTIPLAIFYFVANRLHRTALRAC